VSALLIILSFAIFLSSCATLGNIEWAQQNNIPYVVVIIPNHSWKSTVLGNGGSSIDSYNWICFWKAPDLIFIQEGYESCLEHEIGHIREWKEGFPPHSKYSY